MKILSFKKAVYIALAAAALSVSAVAVTAAKVVPHISESRCSGCGDCIRICPPKANSITLVHGKAVIDPVTCISCRKCIYVCSYGACK